MGTDLTTLPGPPEVLLVDDIPSLLRSVGSLLEQKYVVAYADSGHQALKVLASSPGIKVVIADYDMPGMSGIELLKRIADLHPATARIMLTGVLQIDIACDAIQETRLHRFLCKPCPVEDLREAVKSGVDAHEEFVQEELETELLVFSNESLLVLNRNLEQRYAHQNHSIGCLRRLGVCLNRAQDLDAIARVAAAAACEALDNRGTCVQFSGPNDIFAECSVGPEMSMRVMSEPLTTKDGTIGEITVDVLNSEGREISSTQRNILAAIAAITAVAVHNEIRRTQRDEAQYATVFALARLSEIRDLETGQHLERVSEFCRLIAESLVARGLHLDQITAPFISDLVLSAPLHDIGKVGIPDSILLKKGKLTPEEWKIMKTHTQIGADTLRGVLGKNQTQTYLRMGFEIALGHHEKWDGSGYPGELVGDDIPLCARILALADVYDALTAVRPYKGAWSHAQARKKIVEGRGAHFDPNVVDAFLDCHEEMADVRRRLGDDEPGQGPDLGLQPESA